jgi:hypothetical protein
MAGESFKLVAALAVAVPALLGFVIASYLALYQWGVFSTVWEPFFGAGNRTILNSSVSSLADPRCRSRRVGLFSRRTDCRDRGTSSVQHETLKV